MKKDTWVVVANSWHARIFRVEKNRILEEIETLEHPESRELDHELTTSKPGRTFDRMGTGRHAMEPKNSPKNLEFAEFADQLSQHLEKARENGKFARLYFAAGPTFLGLVRQSFTPATAELIAAEIDKDITSLKPDEIREYFPLVV